MGDLERRRNMPGITSPDIQGAKENKTAVDQPKDFWGIHPKVIAKIAGGEIDAREDGLITSIDFGATGELRYSHNQTDTIFSFLGEEGEVELSVDDSKVFLNPREKSVTFVLFEGYPNFIPKGQVGPFTWIKVSQEGIEYNSPEDNSLVPEEIKSAAREASEVVKFRYAPFRSHAESAPPDKQKWYKNRKDPVPLI